MTRTGRPPTARNAVLAYVRDAHRPVTYADVRTGTGVCRVTAYKSLNKLYRDGHLKKMFKPVLGLLKPHFFVMLSGQPAVITGREEW